MLPYRALFDLPFYGRVVPLGAVGWFRLKSGEKALLALTGRRHALYVPTTQGYALLSSARDPDQLLEARRDYAAD